MYRTRLSIVSIILFILFTGCDRDQVEITGQPMIQMIPVRVMEGNQPFDLMHYTIRLEHSYPEDLVLFWSTEGQTALAGADFTEMKEQKMIIPAGETSADIPIEILGDTLLEFTEHFELRVQYPFNGINQSLRAVITIENDDYINPEVVADGYMTSLQYPGMQLLWHEEFDQDQVNNEYWNYDAPNAFPMNCGGSDDEIGRYTGDNEHLKLRDGKLIMTATFDPLTGIYRSTRVNSKEKVNIQYGRIDFRAKLAGGTGLASSLLMLGKDGEWPAAGEIDVLKMAGKESGSVTGGLVYEDEGIKSLEKKSTLADEPFNLTDHFHVYTLLWEEDRITWLLDYSPFFEVSRETFPDEYIFNSPGFLKINLAVGGTFAGLPDLSTEFPCSMELDYIRVYQPLELINHD